MILGSSTPSYSGFVIACLEVGFEASKRSVGEGTASCKQKRASRYEIRRRDPKEAECKESSSFGLIELMFMFF